MISEDLIQQFVKETELFEERIQAGRLTVE